jgi:hypothetical protein
MMMRSMLIVAAFASTAVAGGTFADKTEYRHSNATSIKVTDPEGFKVTVALPNGDKTDTVPAMFTLPDQDSYVKVTVVAPDGTTWSKKVEVRAKQQAELSLQFKADAAQPAGGHTYVGKFLNEAGGCGPKWKRQIRVDFINADGSKTKQQLIDNHKTVDLEIPGGKYDVRVYVENNGGYDFVLSQPEQISKDNWNMGFGCQNNKIVIAAN